MNRVSVRSFIGAPQVIIESQTLRDIWACCHAGRCVMNTRPRMGMHLSRHWMLSPKDFIRPATSRHSLLRCFCRRDTAYWTVEGYWPLLWYDLYTSKVPVEPGEVLVCLISWMSPCFRSVETRSPTTIHSPFLAIPRRPPLEAINSTTALPQDQHLVDFHL